MQVDRRASAPNAQDRVLALEGPSARLYVEDNQLHAEDRPYGNEVRIRRVSRGTCKVDRILVLSRNGSISLAAVRWTQKLGIALALVGSESSGIVMQTTLSPRQDTKLRRAQALAQDTELGLQVSRYLLSEKCRGQRGNLVRLGYGTSLVDSLCKQIGQAESLNGCLGIEGELAAIYWDCWRELPIRLENGKAPEHWQMVGQRTSSKTKGPKTAITPVNAMLNYLYRLAEIEVTIALHAVGLDPAFGFFHTDFPNRNSMALDCLEAIRPAVDQYVLSLIETRPFSKEDFTETDIGEVRMGDALRGELHKTMPIWREAIASVIEHVADMLRPTNAVGRKASVTPLTRKNARNAQTTIKQRRKAS